MIANRLATLAALAATLLFTATAAAQSAGRHLLWQIGAGDHANSEFALAPGAFSKFKSDGFFVIGQSDPHQDWPYVQPGPADSWGGSQPHTFVIVFGLKSLPESGECQLRLALLDAHNNAPPQLRIAINGQEFERKPQRGNGDESIQGHPETGRSQNVDVKFPGTLLRPGNNEILITTASGCWILYDAVQLETPAGGEVSTASNRTVIAGAEAIRGLEQRDGKLFQSVHVTLRHFGPPFAGRLALKAGIAEPVTVATGETKVELLVPAVSQTTTRNVSLTDERGTVLTWRQVKLAPVRHLTVYLLPHSHTDIGYTEIQTDIEKKQVNNLLEGMAAARATATNPPGARFVWNVEVLWAADLFMQRRSPEEKARFLAAVKSGEVVLNGAYLNELTGLCRPEELLQLFRPATQFAAQTGGPIDSVMISDVPGYTWGMVPAMAQAGIKYFSAAPNYFDRIGTILREWENRPFYWVGPDGQSKVLVWIPFWGYALSHRYGELSPRLINDLSDHLDQRQYPFDLTYLRWAGHGDNATPDPAICEFVRKWNAKYVWPHFVISGTSQAFRAFEQRYGEKLPRVRGDWTPYWEDGAGSSALETAMNRQSSDRLTQAETLHALLRPTPYPAGAFAEAWRKVLLYSEHTWGADCSISAPESQKTREQWDIKQDYARQADLQSRTLFQTALEPDRAAAPIAGFVDVVNSLSWSRSEIVRLPPALAAAAGGVQDSRGRALPAQRLHSGELAFRASDVPAFGTRRYTLTPSAGSIKSPAIARGAVLENGLILLRVDEKTGGIAELTARGVDGNLVDLSGGETLNDYRYLPGEDLAGLKRNGPVTIHVGENGPLVASLIVESAAPGCNRLRREIRLTAGGDFVELINEVDKSRLQTASYHAKEGKESVNFAFPFHVPDGEMQLEVPFGVITPERDQMPSACKNWFTVARWADVANSDHGIAWVTLDAPLVEVGGITANLLNSQTNPDVWRKKVGRTQKLYSWAMNNHWGTNYRAYQEGPTVFRFVLRPHRRTTPAEISRFATALSQPLWPRPAVGPAPAAQSLVRVEGRDILVTALKPSDDGKALILRLFAASAKATKARLVWETVKPRQVWLSNTSEAALTPAPGAIDLPPWGVVSLRAELP